jgi:hypothetical protein
VPPPGCAGRRSPVATNIGDNYGSVPADRQLGSVAHANPSPLDEAEGVIQERHRGTYIRVDEDWRDRRRRH